MTLDEMITVRRSIRQYAGTPVEREKLMQILEAGRLAPSANNHQNWRFTLVLNDSLRQELVPACRGQEMVAQAPAALVVWSVADSLMPCNQSRASIDCSIALSFMMLKATELGLGTCWLGAFDASEVAKLLNLPEGAVPVAVTPIGYPAEQPAARPRKALDEIIDIRE